jgi:hypothetical protein
MSAFLAAIWNTLLAWAMNGGLEIARKIARAVGGDRARDLVFTPCR